MREEGAGNSLRAWAAPFFILVLLSLTPIIVPLSYRNIAAQVMLMGLLSALHPSVLSSVMYLFRARLHPRNTSVTLMISLLIILIYALSSSFWSEAPFAWLSVLQFFFVVVLSATFLLFALNVDLKIVKRVCVIYMLGVILGGWLIGIEALSGSWIRDMLHEGTNTDKDAVSSARGASLAIYLMIPLCYALVTDNIISQRLKGAGRKLVIISVGGAVLVAAVLLPLEINIIAFLMASLSAIAAFLIGRNIYDISIKLAVLGLIFTPFLFILLPPIDQLSNVESLPVSWTHRLIIWRYTAEEVLSGPLQFFFGGGAQAAWALSMDAETILVATANQPLSMMSGHPHNLFLQLWLEFGLVGVAIVTLVCTQLLRFNISKAFSPSGMAAICALLGVFLVFAMVETNLWSYWRLAAPTLALFGIFLVHRLES